MKIRDEVASGIICPNCNHAVEIEADRREQRFDVYKWSCSEELRKRAAGFWMVEKFAPMLVAQCSEDEEDFVQAVMLDDYDEPGFNIVEFADAEYWGKARIRISSRGLGNRSAPLGQLYVRKGHAGITYFNGLILLLEVPLAGAEHVPDGDYGFNWDVECSQDGTTWRTVYEAEESKSWLNAWRPEDEEILSELPRQLAELQETVTDPNEGQQ